MSQGYVRMPQQVIESAIMTLSADGDEHGVAAFLERAMRDGLAAGPEPVAQILGGTWGNHLVFKDERYHADEKYQGQYLYLAAPPQQDGWKLVPVELTAAMHGAGDGTIRRLTGHDGTWLGGQVYKAMLAAAPLPPTEPK